jgi:hypothetical protein
MSRFHVMAESREKVGSSRWRVVVLVVGVWSEVGANVVSKMEV